MPTSPFGLLGLGFVLGLRHALDVDHLAAVSTIVGGRRGVWGGAVVGAVWGLGHTAALLAVGAVVIALRAEIPPRVATGLELAVAVMLVGLGTNLLVRLARGARVHAHPHRHGDHFHSHPHVHAPHSHADAPDHAVAAAHDHGLGAGRPFAVGLVHGLAGSAGLMLAVLATIPQPAVAVAYVAVFGAGSIGGMVAMSTLLGLPFHLLAGRFARAERLLGAGAGVGSIAVGLVLAWRLT
jgi:hypothetical protein